MVAVYARSVVKRLLCVEGGPPLRKSNGRLCLFSYGGILVLSCFFYITKCAFLINRLGDRGQPPSPALRSNSAALL
jgi:hypothetical protein